MRHTRPGAHKVGGKPRVPDVEHDSYRSRRSGRGSGPRWGTSPLPLPLPVSTTTRPPRHHLNVILAIGCYTMGWPSECSYNTRTFVRRGVLKVAVREDVWLLDAYNGYNNPLKH
eukprot:6594115-Pyramimonas_sp.AAC.1